MDVNKKPTVIYLRWLLLATVATMLVIALAGCAAPTEQPTAAPVEKANEPTTLPTREPTPVKPTPAALQFPLPVSKSTSVREEAREFPIPASFSADRVEASLDFPLPAPEQGEAVATKADDSACITCHTDEDILQQLATEPEDAGEALSEGEG